MKRKRLLIIAIVIIVTLAAVAVALSIYIKGKMDRIPALSAMDCLDYTLKGAKGGVISIGTIKDGEMEWTVYGEDSTVLPHTAHIYEIGSLAKTMTASLIAKAEAEGKLRIEDSIDHYLPLQDGREYPTILSLLTHTSGYKSEYIEKEMISNFFKGRNAFYGIKSNTVITRIEKAKTKNNDWEYSNFGYAILGEVLESVYGVSYKTLVEDYLTQIGMTSSYISDGKGDLGNYWDWNDDDAFLSAGAVLSTIEDMLLYARLQLEEEGFIKDAHQKLMDVEASSRQYRAMDINIDAMAMGWILDEKNGIIWHNGGTDHYNSYLGFDPESKSAVVILSNLDGDYRIPATVIGIKMLKEMRGER